MRSLELFAGAGGMALGLHRAGIRAEALVEYNHAACDTLRAAVAAGRLCGEVIEGDAGAIDYARFRGVDLVCGGPPCQPFSEAGRGLGKDDDRNGWPHFIKAVREARPRFVLAENVRGFLSEAFDSYRFQIIRDLEALGYTVCCGLLNAADYGVPQTRERVFLFGGLDGAPPWPTKTHHAPHKGSSLFSSTVPWVSAGDAIGGLPSGAVVLSGNATYKHSRRREDAVPYERCGSLPAPTVRGAPWHSVRLPGGRSFTATRAHRSAWQAFPGAWPFAGSVSAINKQIGNAVPPPLAEALGRSILTASQA